MRCWRPPGRSRPPRAPSSRPSARGGRWPGPGERWGTTSSRPAGEGPAYPVRVTTGDNLALHHAIYRAPRGAVLVGGTGDPTHGYWGELMSRAALARGLAGLVLDGGVRDLAAIRKVGFPVFAPGTGLRSTAKRVVTRLPPTEAVALGPVSVELGDLVVGDEDGVVVLPRAEVETVRARARELEEWEGGILRGLAEGRRLTELLELPPEGSAGA